MKRFLVALGLVTLSLPHVVAQPKEVVPADHATKMTASTKLFKESVRDILVKNCLDCHGGAKTKAGLSIASRELLLKGGDRGVSVVPGKSKESKLFKLVTREDEPHMPPKMPLAKEAITKIGEWIDLGAAYDKPLVEGVETSTKKPLSVTDKDREYWAYRPLQKTEPPVVKNAEWSRNAIDRFILAKLEAAKIAPTTDADKRTLIRRVTFDLTGLPPSVADVEAFLNDKDANAFEKIVDRLLATPAYGERWARHWLDPARYAESHGFEHDYFRPNAYHYRDFVIKALNNDMPYDQFVKWQIAGDEYAPNDKEAVAATGFLGAGVYPTQITNREAERVRYDAMDDMLATTGHAMLALTVGCARCHDHKFDPIPVKDYYRMLSAFTTTVRAEVEFFTGTDDEKAKEIAYDLALKVMQDQLKKLKPADEKHKELKAKIAEFEKTKPKSTKIVVQATTEGQKPMRHHTADGSIPDFYPTTHFLKRGDAEQKDGEANLGFLQVLSRRDEARWQAPKPKEATTSFRRTNLATWITDTEGGAGGLAARVMVNRLWHHHFGRGIVATLNDFGFQSEPPTHPELLEWLANDLVSHGWKLKRLHKLMVMSRTYQLGGTPNAEALKIDPDNKLVWHRPKRRLEAEAIRDNWLAVSGQLDPTMYGPGLADEGMKRRSLYFRIQRSQLIPSLQVFDWPDTLTSASARSTTTVAPQALLFLNNPHVRTAAKALGERMKPHAEKSAATAVEWGYQTVFGRAATQQETTMGVEFLAAKSNKDKALQDYALVLFSLNEFIYVD
jgi:cytochrome c553